MTLAGVVELLARDPAVAQLRQQVAATTSQGSDAQQAADVVACAGSFPAVLAAMSGAAAVAPLVVVTATSRHSAALATSLRAQLPPDAVVELPAWETLPHERLSPRADTVGRRLAVLRRLVHPDAHASDTSLPAVVVAPVRAIMQPVAAGVADVSPVVLRPGDSADLAATAQQLADAAYTRTDMVTRRGEFAVRGGIVDVFAPTADHPWRVEFWGDTVEEVRWFSVADQRSLEVCPQGVWAPPCRELLLTPTVRQRAADLIDQLPGVADMLESIAQGIACEGMESLIGLLTPMHSVVELLPEKSTVVVVEPELIRRRAADVIATSEEFVAAAWSNVAAGNQAPIDLQQLGFSAGSFFTLDEVHQAAGEKQLPWWTLSTMAHGESDEPSGDAAHNPDQETDLRVQLVVATQPVPDYRGDSARLMSQLRSLTAAGWHVVVCAPGHGSAQRMSEILAEEQLPARLVEAADTDAAGVIQVTTAQWDHGFIAPDAALALITQSDVSGKRSGNSKSSKLPSRRRAMVDPLQLRAGDFVVHEQHGVGRYVEMMQRTVGGATREYLVIEYAPSKRGQPGDRLFVPSDCLDQVTKYVGGEAPALNKMGGSDWAKTKGRARKAVRQIAGELIRLYSARMASPGHPFGQDSPWQAELEDAFSYVETPDQLSCIDDVKADMEKPIPMDRLVCGDVGYGKTEIAVRAAFKAVQDGKQVAILVPTTLLVQQHLETFADRYENFPVTVKPLSRFQTDKQARETLAGLADGSVDVVIGTHRLLSEGIVFKDLGLIVVDEEQRFGVEHKEKLKHLRTNVDVLAMSATPIPRTLEMAVTGIREMSTLATPPEDRHPVLTFVGAYDERQITAAIRRELLREGQVFYIHNRVESIDRVAAKLRELVPEARIQTAHGSMGEHRLEQVIVDFWNKEFDVLVCTTIVENGLDIANANTLILERADMLGLSQLHQLRGRVGRSKERAYAYFLYPPEKPLTETAHDRLATIAQHTDLGAGMQVAMKDLEIRGAGNLLGGEQSGHIAGVGFDLYVRMVSEAVAEFRGEADSGEGELRVELAVDAHLPHEYVPSERLRLEAYRKIADVTEQAALDAIRQELLDRYGQPPEPVDNLLEVARLRIVARRAKLTDITTQGNYIKFAPLDLSESATIRLNRLYPGSLVKPALHAVLVPRPTTARIGGQPLRDVPLLRWAAELIEAVAVGSVKVAASIGTSTGSK